MSLKDWLIEKMGEEYVDDMTTSENVTSLVEEVRLFRELARIERTHVQALIEWITKYDDWSYENAEENTGDIHQRSKEHAVSETVGQ